jgi:hypothetical protein
VNRGGRVAAVLLAAALGMVACSGDDGPPRAATDTTATTAGTEQSDGSFCESMAHLIELLAPSGPTSPSETRATFEEATTWFEQARGSAPDSISEDVDVYAAAYAEYIDGLGEVGFDLDVLFSTPEGHDLAIDTSHSLTEPIVGYVTGECGLSFDDQS